LQFRYPLQKLVDLKTNEKEQAEWMLSEALGRLSREEQSLKELEDEQRRAGEALQAASAGRTTISRMQQLQEYRELLEQRIRLKIGDVRKAQSDVDDKRSRLVEKTLEEKVWHKAREKAHLKFVAFVQKKEQAELDEIALNRRVRTI
jgi:flagellar FliJ protein